MKGIAIISTYDFPFRLNVVVDGNDIDGSEKYYEVERVLDNNFLSQRKTIFDLKELFPDHSIILTEDGLITFYEKENANA